MSEMWTVFNSNVAQIQTKVRFFPVLSRWRVCVFGFGKNSNAGIRELPPELGQLSNLWQLDIENLTVTNVPQEIRKEGIGLMFFKIMILLLKEGTVQFVHYIYTTDFW